MHMGFDVHRMGGYIIFLVFLASSKVHNPISNETHKHTFRIEETLILSSISEIMFMLVKLMFFAQIY